MKNRISFLCLFALIMPLFALSQIAPLGSGSAEDPYRINSIDNLLYLKSNPSTYTSSYIKQTSDIDLSSQSDANRNIALFSSETPFQGTYDGDGHTIKGLQIRSSSSADVYLGFFRYTKGATVKNLTIENSTIVNYNKSSSQYGGGTGLLIGCNDNNGTTETHIENCHIKGISTCEATNNVGSFVGLSGTSSNPNAKVHITYSTSNAIISNDINCGYFYNNFGGFIGNGECDLQNCSELGPTSNNKCGDCVGGLVGLIKGQSTINNCFVTGDVGKSKNTSKTGGFIGSVDSNATITITNSYYSGTIKTTNSTTNVGGLIGYNGGNSVTITNCYVLGSVTGKTNIGGLVGNNVSGQLTIQDCRVSGTLSGNSYMGGIIGNDGSANSAAILNSNIFSDIQSTVPSTTGIVIGSNDNSYSTCKYLSMPQYNSNIIHINGATQITSVSSGTTLTVDASNVSNYANAPFVIKEGGKLINNTNQLLTAYVEKILGIEKWNFIASPFVDGTTLQNIFNGYNLAAIRFDYSTNSWENNNNELLYMYNNNICDADLGFFVWPFGVGNTYSNILLGPITLYNKESENFTLNNIGSITTENSVSGYLYALGNSYQANMSVSSFAADNPVQGTCAYVFNPTNQTFSTSNIIPPHTGFFVFTSNGGQKQFTIKRSYLTTSSKAAKSQEPMQIKVTPLQDSCNSASVFFYHNSTASNGFDIQDAFVLFGFNDTVVTPYSLVDGEKIINDYFAAYPYETEIDMLSYKDKDVKITFNNLPSHKVFFIDSLLHQNIELSEDTQYITHVNEGTNSGRFFLKFTTIQIGLHSVDTLKENNISAWLCNNILNINGEGLKSLYIYNILGQCIFSYSLQGEKYSKTLNFPMGTYSAKILNSKGSKIYKFIINK